MSAKIRIAIAALSLSAAGFVGIVVREGYSSAAYPDPVLGEKVPTIGFGSTDNVKMGDTITPVGAVQRTHREVGVYERGVKGCVSVDLAQHEYDAYVELAHNTGVKNFCRAKDGGPSAIARHLQARQYEAACDAILLYKYSGGVDCSAPGNRTCSGLWKDRLRLHAMCKGQR